MKIKTIAVSNIMEHTAKLQASLIKYHIDFAIISCKWQGFFTKIYECYRYCKTLQDYDYILFVDAHDVIFISDIHSIKAKLKKFLTYDCVFSTEKACWPESSLAQFYPDVISPWKYLNSGSYLFKIEKIIKLIEENPIYIGMDDQLYFTQMYLSGKMNGMLDIDCEIFQSVAFEAPGDFTITKENKLINNVTNSYPIILHGNGKTDMTKFYGL